GAATRVAADPTQPRTMPEQHDILTADVIEFITSAYAVEAPRPDPSPWPVSLATRATFDALAARVLRPQAIHNKAYLRYARARGVEAEALTDPLDAPPVPTDAFKRQTLTTFDPALAVATFRSSGTTLGRRGAHHFKTLDVMRASIEGP